MYKQAILMVNDSHFGNEDELHSEMLSQPHMYVVQ